MIRPFFLDCDVLRVLDQRLLPREERWLDVTDCDGCADVISTMAVRGAPAIGCVAAWGVAFAARDLAAAGLSDEDARNRLRAAGERLVATRPTAVNLPWAVARLLAVADATPVAQWSAQLAREAETVTAEDLAACQAIGRHGLDALPPGRLTVLTHCNAGALATAGHGTALGIVRALHDAGRLARVYADDTRPRQQGARLTAWELHREGLPVTLVADTVAGHLLQHGAVDAIVTGADRVAANGDAANKIGTYQLAVLAAHHGVPFFIAAPTSTVDLACPTGDDIVIEERDPDEVRRVDDVWVAPADVDAFNPAFDVTPGSLITAIVTERGVVRPSYRETLPALMKNRD